jgi:hypothetical protein
MSESTIPLRKVPPGAEFHPAGCRTSHYIRREGYFNAQSCRNGSWHRLAPEYPVVVVVPATEPNPAA